MKRTTINLPNKVDVRLRHKAIDAHLGGGGQRRRLIAAKAGRSGRHDTARTIEEIIRRASRR